MWNTDNSITVIDGFYPQLNKDINMKPINLFLEHDHYKAIQLLREYSNVQNEIMQVTPKGRLSVRPVTVAEALRTVEEEIASSENVSNT